jgi:peptidoglycan/LPS O-acetylase OafA/YrhL
VRLLWKLQDSHVLTVVFQACGFALMLSMIILMQVINNSPNDVPEFLNFLYLVSSRPIFAIGFSMNIFPVLIGAKACKPVVSLLSHEFWVPISRLTYGAYLSHGVFMVFRGYNSERGEWACSFDCFLFFFAFLTFSYVFAFLTGVLIEMPCLALVREFVVKRGIGMG